MSSVIRSGVLLLALGTSLSHVAEAQVVRQRTVIRQKTVIRNCSRCQRQTTQCVCPQPVCAPPQPQMTMRPVYDTQYREEQCVVNRAFTETHFRDEQYCVTVPVTVCENITVDEGCYQQIWVPKMVTKQIPKTVLTQQSACRSVPYQVTKCAPEIMTRKIPYQTVRYVPTPGCVPGMTNGPLPAVSNYPFPPASYNPATASAPPPASSPIADYSTPPSTATPYGDPKFLQPPEPPLSAEGYRNRIANELPYDNSQLSEPRPIRKPMSDSRFGNDDALSSRSLPTPSAAAVWRTPRPANP